MTAEDRIAWRLPAVVKRSRIAKSEDVVRDYIDSVPAGKVRAHFEGKLRLANAARVPAIAAHYCELLKIPDIHDADFVVSVGLAEMAADMLLPDDQRAVIRKLYDFEIWAYALMRDRRNMPPPYLGRLLSMHMANINRNQ